MKEITCQEILTKEKQVSQETLIKTLLKPKTQASNKEKRFGAHEKKNSGTNIHLGNVVLGCHWRALC
jgi:hypothetical protein